jgi:uncharacterized protein (TIGR00255 family)
MIRSMTAFARQSNQHDWGSLVWEIRSVNHRYLEPSFKLPESIRRLEGKLREKIRQQLNRGKVECSLRLQSAPGSSGMSVDVPLVKQLLSAAESIQQQMHKSTGINPLEILNWPGVLVETQTDEGKLAEHVLSSFQVALEQLVETREREGNTLSQFIEQRIESIQVIISAARQQMPAILDAQKQKTLGKLAELAADLDPARLEQETVILIQKADIDEELDRLDTHLIEVQRILKKGGACGRRLDFLMQELNREANTLSSKSIITDTTQAAVELKVLIEQMREQIQNIE